MTHDVCCHLHLKATRWHTSKRFFSLAHEASQSVPCVDLCSSFQDMIHIADTKVERRYGDFFIRQIHKFDEVRRTESVNLQLPLHVFQLHISIPETSMKSIDLAPILKGCCFGQVTLLSPLARILQAD